MVSNYIPKLLPLVNTSGISIIILKLTISTSNLNYMQLLGKWKFSALLKIGVDKVVSLS